MMYSTLSNYDYDEDNNMSGDNNDDVRRNEHLRPHPSPTGQAAGAEAAAGGGGGTGGTASVVANVVEDNDNVDEQRRRRRSSIVGRGRKLLNKVFATKKRRSGSRSNARSPNGTTDCMVKNEQDAAANSCVGRHVAVEKVR